MLSSPGYIDPSVNGTISTGRIERSIAVLFIVVQTCGWFIRLKLSVLKLIIKETSCSIVVPASHLAWKSPTIIELGSLESGVGISSSPSTLLILCSYIGLLLSHIRVESPYHFLNVFVPLPPMVLCVFFIVTITYPHTSIVLW